MNDNHSTATVLDGPAALMRPGRERQQLFDLSTSRAHQDRTLRASAAAVGKFLLHFLASLLTMSPIAAVFSHIAMHIAAVLHGVETVAQLPPHYAL